MPDKIFTKKSYENKRKGFIMKSNYKIFVGKFMNKK